MEGVTDILFHNIAAAASCADRLDNCVKCNIFKGAKTRLNKVIYRQAFRVGEVVDSAAAAVVLWDDA